LLGQGHDILASVLLGIDKLDSLGIKVMAKILNVAIINHGKFRYFHVKASVERGIKDGAHGDMAMASIQSSKCFYLKSCSALH
jgi:hypothetical protein